MLRWMAIGFWPLFIVAEIALVVCLAALYLFIPDLFQENTIIVLLVAFPLLSFALYHIVGKVAWAIIMKQARDAEASRRYYEGWDKRRK